MGITTKENKKKKKQTLCVGTLSNLNNINFGDQSPFYGRSKERETPTPSGMKEEKLNLLKMMEEPLSGRNYPLKATHLKGEEEEEEAPKAKPTHSNFSYFLQKNYMKGEENKKRKNFIPIENNDTTPDNVSPSPHYALNDLNNNSEFKINILSEQNEEENDSEIQNSNINTINTMTTMDSNINIGNLNRQNIPMNNINGNIQIQNQIGGQMNRNTMNNQMNNQMENYLQENSENPLTGQGILGNNQMYLNQNNSQEYYDTIRNTNDINIQQGNMRNFNTIGNIGRIGNVNNLNNINMNNIPGFQNQILSQNNFNNFGNQMINNQFLNQMNIGNNNAFLMQGLPEYYLNNQMLQNNTSNLINQLSQMNNPQSQLINPNQNLNFQQFNFPQNNPNKKTFKKKNQMIKNPKGNQKITQFSQQPQNLSSSQIQQNPMINSVNLNQNDFPQIGMSFNQQSMNQQKINQNIYSQQMFPNNLNSSLNSTQKKPRPNKVPNYTNMPLTEVLKNSNMLSKDQMGCRYLQKKIKEQPEIVPKILNNALQNITEIITDCFGNYLIQKLFDYMDEQQFYQLLSLIKMSILEICENSYGTRVMQKIVDHLKTDALISTFMNLIQPIVKDIILNINGSHILLKILSLRNPLSNKIIYNEICANIVPIAKHKHGCCVLQKCIDNAEEENKAMILSEIVKQCNELIRDQCGNYIIQFIIGFNNVEINSRIVDQLVLDIEGYSKQKYSSNVVEKCLESCSNELCEKIISVINSNDEIILNLLFDKFGNYVIQKTLQRADDMTQRRMLEVIAPHYRKLNNYPFGIKLYPKLVISFPYLGKLVCGEPQINSQI
ncbi:MAG: hypothetical protein MJ252_20440 [archaeon]|nr:hypothetical protein [archaeon]